jgi:protein phosphatase
VSDPRSASGARTFVTLDDRVCGATDIGRQRENNEDRFYVSADPAVLALADGLGGLPAGEVAAELAVAAARALLEARVAECSDEVFAIELLGDVFRAANRSILEAARDPARQGMATTLVAGFVCSDTLFLSHVGDVRAYHYGKRGLERLTEDHTSVWEFVRDGVLTEDEARVHPMRNALTRVLGLRQRIDPSFRAVPLASGDMVLLCSDGIWEPVSHRDIGAELEAPSAGLEERARRLLDRAIDAGGPDNATLTLYRHGA